MANLEMMNGSLQAFINALPDEILEIIFGLTPEIEDLISYSKVCRRWRALAQRRLAQINYLVSYDGKPGDKSQHVYIPSTMTGRFGPSCRIGRIGRKLILYNKFCENERLLCYLKVLPNLKFLKAVRNMGPLKEEFERELCSKPSLKGVFVTLDGPMFPEKSKFLKRVEMIFPIFCEPRELSTESLKLLHVGWDWDLVYFNFRNLRRCRMERFKGTLLNKYCGPKLETIEILEFFVERNCYLGLLLDLCPRLKSLFLLLHRITERFFPKNEVTSLEDLVLEYYDEDKADRLDVLIAFLRYFPNLKNLAIRFNGTLKCDHIPVILMTCPNLETLDLRGCFWIKEETTIMCNDYAIRRGKPLSFYRGNCPYLPRDNVKEVICLGFDFMKHIFFKRYEDAPLFLTEED